MRLAVLVALLAGLFGYTQAQEFGKDRKDKSTQVMELGGKTLDQWIKDVSGKDRSKGEHAIHMILLFPPDQAYAAVPALLGELNKHKPGLTPIDLSIRVNCTIALGVILGSAKSPSPGHIKEAVRLCTGMLADRQDILRYRAAEALGRIGPEARGALEALLPLVKDPHTWEIRWAATAAIGSIAVDLDQKKGPILGTLSALYYALSDTSGKVRMSAIQSLTVIGPAANPENKKALINHLDLVTQKDIEPTVRIWAHMAIMNISYDGKEPLDEKRIAAVAKMLQHQEATVRIQAATAIGVLGKEARKHIPALRAALRDKEPEVLLACMVALTRMGRNALPAVPEIEKLKGDMQLPEGLRRAAAEAIEVIQGFKAGEKVRVP